MHQNLFFELKNKKKLWGGGTDGPQTSPTVGKGRAPPHTPRRLDPRDYGARLVTK